MTSKEFTIWLQGFTVACHEYAPTPKQWDILKDTLSNVSDVNGFNNIIHKGSATIPNPTNHYEASNIESTETVQSYLQGKFPF
jgi:hypothetical protein